MKTDINIIAAVLSGNTREYSHLVSRYQNMVYGIGLKFLNDSNDAEDLAQEVFIKVYKSLAKYKGDSKFSTWIYRVAYNTALDKVKSSRYKHSRRLDEINEQEIADDTVVTESEGTDFRKDLIKRAIDKLPADQQVIISLFYFEELSLKEIALITKFTEANVKVKLHRSRKKLYDLLEKYKEPLTTE